MALIDDNGQCILEPGAFEIYLGGSQPDQRSRDLTQTKVLKALFEVTGEPMELKY
jgi:beta-glucosidase